VSDGAELALTYLDDRTRPYVEPLGDRQSRSSR